MKKMAITAALAASLGLSACATQPGYGYQDPYQAEQNRRAATGAAAGALGGAVAGAILPGVKPVTGAIAGAVLGGVLASVVNGRQYYRDTRGYCYYVDQYGRPVYNYNTRC